MILLALFDFIVCIIVVVYLVQCSSNTASIDYKLQRILDLISIQNNNK